MRRREKRQEEAHEVQDAGKRGLEAEDELVDPDLAVREIDGLAEKLHARERAVHDVEVHRRREQEDEQRRQREVGDERPAGRRLPEDFLHARDEGSHEGLSDVGPGGLGGAP